MGTLKVGGSMRFATMRLKGLAEIGGGAAGERCHIKAVSPSAVIARRSRFM